MTRSVPAVLLLASLAAAAREDALPAPDVIAQAFDGAMTCSAVAAVTAREVAAHERWRWDNRSFAFGMLAARFWNDARGEPMAAEQLNDALNRYAEAYLEMTPERRAVFEQGCADKYADVDKLCAENPCLHDGPPPSPPVDADS